MANWTNLLSSINNVIKQNGNQEITGTALQGVLKNIINSIGENATFVDIATPATNPGVPNGPVFYLASEGGTYTNFGHVTVQPNEIAFLKWNNNAWKKVSTRILRYEKDTEAGGRIIIAHTLDDRHAGIYYAERNADGQVIHEDSIYLTETYGNDNGHISISSVDNENGVAVRSGRVIVKPTQVTIQNNSGYLQFANDAAEMRSNKSDDGLDSVMRLTREQAWLTHYRPYTVPYVNPTTGKTEQRQSGIGVVANDNSITFYSELGNYTAPLRIDENGKIYLAGVTDDLATYIKSLQQRIATLEARLTNTTEVQE